MTYRNSSTGWRTGGWLVLAVLALTVGIGLATASPARATSVQRCEYGVSVRDLYGLDVEGRRFSVSLDLWSRCDRPGVGDITNTTFYNANTVSKDPVRTTSSPKSVHQSMTVRGVFRKTWTMRYYPFDRQILQIIVFPGGGDNASVTPTLDTTGSSVVEDPGIDGFRIAWHHIDLGWFRTDSREGDPSAGLEVRRPMLVTAVEVHRTNRSSALALLSPMGAALLATFVNFFFSTRSHKVMLGRIGLNGAALFTMVLSLQSVHADLHSSEFSLLDQAQLVGLCYAIVATATTAVGWRLVARGCDDAAIQGVDRWCGGVATGLLLLALTALTVLAAILAHDPQVYPLAPCPDSQGVCL